MGWLDRGGKGGTVLGGKDLFEPFECLVSTQMNLDRIPLREIHAVSVLLFPFANDQGSAQGFKLQSITVDRLFREEDMCCCKCSVTAQVYLELKRIW